MTNIIIKNGRVIDPFNQIDQVKTIYIQNGRIDAFDQAPENFKTDYEIDASNQIVCSGLIDLSARVCGSSVAPKEEMKSEMLAAAKGGITTLCCPPDTDPVIDHPAINDFIVQRAKECDNSRVVTLGALTQSLQGEQLSQMGALQQAGCVGVSNARKQIIDTKILRRCFEYAATLNLTVFINAEDPWLAEDGCMHEGMISTRLGLSGIPSTAETIAISRDLQLIEQTGVRAHFSQLSCGHSVELIEAAIKRKLPVTADVAIHHLHLTEIDVNDFNTQCHVQPPLRSLRDQEILLQGVKNGIIQAICSQHEPQNPDNKLLPFAVSATGISGLETLLPLALRLSESQDMSLSNIIRLLTIDPAKILGLDLGHLSVNAIADICVFDPKANFTVDPSQFLSKGHNSPFADWDLQGVVSYTLRAGKVIYQRV